MTSMPVAVYVSLKDGVPESFCLMYSSLEEEKGIKYNLLCACVCVSNAIMGIHKTNSKVMTASCLLSSTTAAITGLNYLVSRPFPQDLGLRLLL